MSRVSATRIQPAFRSILQAVGLIGLMACFFGIPREVSATHLVGGDLTYRYLGENLYEIRLTLRRDCFLGSPDAQFDDPASIGFFDLETNARLNFIGVDGQLLIPYNEDDTLNQFFISDCTISGNDVCVHQTTYVDTINLPLRPGGYLMAYQRCCRNGSLNNVVNPLNTGMTLVATLDFAAQIEGNSSPELGPYAPIYICVGDSIHFQFEASDPDGDSLSYCLITPNAGGSALNPRPQPPPTPPYNVVSWVDPPYSLENIMGGVPLTIDPVTGVMNGVPNAIGQFLVGVCVSSYDEAGNLIETVVREWQYNVRMCRDVPIAGFDALTEQENLSCDSRTISFDNTSEASDEFLWIFDYPNPNSPTSTEQHPTFTFPADGFYQVALIVNDSDMICFDTLITEIGAFESELVADFNVSSTNCSDDVVIEVEDLSEEPLAGFDVESWLWILTYANVSDTSLIQNPNFTLDTSYEDVNLYLQVTSENGCTAETSQTFDVNVLNVEFLAEDTIFICPSDTTPLIVNGDTTYSYIWAPTESLILDSIARPSDPLAFPTETTTYFVTVSDGICTIEDQIVVSIIELPFLNFEVDTDCKSLDISITNLSEGMSYLWDFGDPNTEADTSSAIHPVYTYSEPGIYTITLSSADGCPKDTTMDVTVSIIEEIIEDVPVSCFLESIILNPGGSDAYSYQWEPADLVDNDTAVSPLATIPGNITFYVTITDKALPECSIVDSVNVFIPPDFEVLPPNDTAYCNAQAITLEGGNPDLVYVWLAPDGDTVDTGPSVVLAPEDTTRYFVIGIDSFGCEKLDSFTLLPTFFAYEKSPDTIICRGDSVRIGIFNQDPNQELDYAWEPADAILSGGNTAMPWVRPEENTVFTVFITNRTLGCMVEDSIVVLVSTFNYEIIPDPVICEGGEGTITINNLDTTTLCYDWTPKSAIVSGDTTNMPVVNPGQATTFYVDIIDKTYGCTTTDSVRIEVSSFDYEISTDQLICRGDAIDLNITNLDTTMLCFDWQPKESIVNGDTTATPTVMPEISTIYVVDILDKTYGCETTDNVFVEVSWFDPPDLQVFADPGDITLTESVQLSTNQTAPGLTFAWTGEGLDDPTSPTPVATPGASGVYEYCVTVTNPDNCVISGCVSITVMDPACDMTDVFIPNAFSPNNDGVNDVLFVRSNFITGMELRIFNRWGEQIFISRNQADGWDGTFRGEELPPDVYGYYLMVECPPDQEFFKKGNVTLFR